MSTEPGVVGTNVGPTPGGTPAADLDLSSNPNPHAQGSPPVDLSGPPTFPLGSPPGYFTIPQPVGSGGNPHNVGIPEARAGDNEVTERVSAGLDALAGINLDGSRLPASDAPTIQKMWNDTGQYQSPHEKDW